MADFKPANPDIIVRDVDEVLGDVGDASINFRERFPNACGYVRAHLPAYSKDGNSAVVLFEGGPNGGHPLDWVYMLTRKRKRWEVVWRHRHVWE